MRASKYILIIVSFLLLSLSHFLAMASSVDLEPILLNKDQIPHSIKVFGNVSEAARWTDVKGDNLVYLSTHKSRNDEDQREEELYVAAFRKNGETWMQIWELRDFVESCDLDVTCDYIKGSFEITDLDSNGIGEVGFIYRLDCSGDGGSLNQKLFIVEDGKKYPLRGWVSYVDDNRVNKVTTDMKIDKAFNSAPSIFKRYALNKWKRFTQK